MKERLNHCEDTFRHSSKPAKTLSRRDCRQLSSEAFCDHRRVDRDLSAVRDRVAVPAERQIAALRERLFEVVGFAFLLSAADDAETAQASVVGGDDGPAAVGVVVVSVDDDPVVDRAQLVGASGI